MGDNREEQGAPHSHGHAGGNERRTLWALMLTAGFMAAEVAGGILSGSLALLADAGHMLTDTVALALSFVAFRASRRPATEYHSYGLHRTQILAALANGAALLGIAAWIVIEAVERFLNPVAIRGAPMMAVALIGLAVNVACFLILHGGDRRNLNMRGATLHVLGDLLGSIAAITAATTILWTGWTPIDPILSVGVAFLIVRGGWGLVTSSAHVLMEGAPDGIKVETLRESIQNSVPGVVDVHHVHLWMLTPEQPLVTLHVTIIDGTRTDQEVLEHIQSILAEEFGVHHATIQIERACHSEHAPCSTQIEEWASDAKRSP